MRTPIAWLLLQPVKMFVDGSNVSAAATVQLLFFRTLVFPRKYFHPKKSSKEKKRKFEGKSAEAIKKEHESSSLR